MENTKAVQVLTKWIHFLGYATMEGRHTIDSSFEDLAEASTAAIEALGKQIAKPVKYNNRHGGGADLWNRDYFNCPACGRRLRNKKPDPYCPRCGQALTWEGKV